MCGGGFVALASFCFCVLCYLSIVPLFWQKEIICVGGSFGLAGCNCLFIPEIET